MIQQENQILFKDLCGRLPYGVIIHNEEGYEGHLNSINQTIFGIELGINITAIRRADFQLDTCKPYLRPLSSMTEEEEKEIRMLHHCFYREGNGWITAGVFGINDCGCTVFEMGDILNYLNAHHFDYWGLIERGLAIEAPEGMYKTE